MDQTARRRRRNLIQNIAIALLSVSAVLLFAQLQLYNLGTSEDPLYLERLTGEGSPSRLREFPAPVRVVLTDSYGRYGSLGFTTNSDGFSALGLREALGSVQHLAPSATDAFRGALSGPSIYFDFLNPLPLQVLAELTGAEGTALEGNARCLLLAAGADGSVHLYVWDGADTVLTGTVASTALSIDSLTEAVSQSGMGSVSFAFEVVEMEPLYGKLFPLSILPTELPQLPVLSAASSISGTDWLLAAFGFNINTRERYAEADGTEVITEVEADRSLHIRPSGEITYRSGTDATLEISAQEEVPTAAEAVLGASILLEQLTEDRSGKARLYLESVSQGGDTTQLLFGYQIDGVPIRFSDGGHAAEITLSGTSVTRLTLRFRQYSTAGETSLLLPLRQRLDHGGGEHGENIGIAFGQRPMLGERPQVQVDGGEPALRGGQKRGQLRLGQRGAAAAGIDGQLLAAKPELLRADPVQADAQTQLRVGWQKAVAPGNDEVDVFRQAVCKRAQEICDARIGQQVKVVEEEIARLRPGQPCPQK